MKKQPPVFSFEALSQIMDVSTLFDHVSEPIAITDADGNALYLNPAFFKEFGISFESVNQVGGVRNIYRYPTQRDQIVEVLKKGTIWDGIVEFISGEQILLMDLHAAPIIDLGGQMVAILGTCKRVPEPGLAEQRLIENDNRYQSLLQSKNDLILSVDADYRFLTVNDAYCETFGKKREELIGSSFTPLVHPEDLQHTLEVMKELTYPPHRIYVEQRAFTKDGWRVFAWEDFVIFDVNGRIAEIQAIGRDITDFRKAVASEIAHRTISDSLREVAEALSSTLDLEEVWDKILDEVGHVVPHDCASFLKVHGEIAIISRERGYQKYGATRSLVGRQLLFAEFPLLQKMVEEKNPVFIPDVRKYAGWRYMDDTQFIRSYIGVPIIVDGQVLALLNLDSVSPEFFHEKDIEHVRTFAVHAALALKNALLYRQAHDIAAFEERNRIAKDLHDVVSQTIFSAKVITGSLSRMLDRDVEVVRSGLTDVQELLDRALAEMRTLLFELRPTALIRADLSSLIKQMAQIVAEREGLKLSLTIQDDLTLPPDVQVSFYRIAQEALNNVSKHARANRLWIILKSRDQSQVCLSIRDDGRGFDMDLNDHRSLGLDIMDERASEIEGKLVVRSKPGKGTEVELTWHQNAVYHPN